MTINKRLIFIKPMQFLRLQLSHTCRVDKILGHTIIETNSRIKKAKRTRKSLECYKNQLVITGSVD